MLSFLKDKNFSYPFIIWIIIVLWYFLFVYGFFYQARLNTQDFFTSQSFFIFSRPPKITQEIVIVAIDQPSRNHLNLKWPWERNVTAKLIRAIGSFSPKAIGLDIIFSGVSSRNEDEELVSALKSHPNIVLGYIEGELPLSRFIDATQKTGFIDKPVEKEEKNKIIRKIKTFSVNEEGKINLSLELEIAASYLGITHENIKLDEKGGIFLGNKFIPSRIIPLNYLIHPYSFTTIPAFFVLEKKINPAIFKNKIVLVGATDPLIHDLHLTPLGLFPGVMIIGNSLAMILSERFIYNFPLWLNFIIIFTLGSLILLINKKLKLNISTFLTLLILLTVFGGSLYLRSKDIQFDYFSLFFLCINSYAISNIYRYAYLIYMTNKLRNLAIIDPLTGFYTWRYFNVKLNEELKTKGKSLAFLAVVISNYRRLSLTLDFEELKSLIESLSQHLKSRWEKGFKKVDFCRISQEIIGIATWEEEKQKIEVFFSNLLEEFEKHEFKLKTQTVRVLLKGILIYKIKGKKACNEKIVYNLESSLKTLEKNPQKGLTSRELGEELWEEKKEKLPEDILDFLATDLEEKNKELERILKEVLESKKETEEAYFETICSLVKALEEKDLFTQSHSQRVADLALRIAQKINLSPEECDLIYKAGLLHDLGKIGISDHILHKKEKLSAEEFELIKKHEIMSVEILKPIKSFAKLLPLILHHHERFDGTGYPYGLSKNAIPRGAQILTVADAFDAMTAGRGYKKGVTTEEAIKELERNSGSQFNPVYVETLKEIL